MKWTAIFIILLGLTTCKNQATENQSVSTENDSIETVQYSENELISFLDSIGKLNPDFWIKELSFMVDSTLNNQTVLNHELTISDFEKLKHTIKNYTTAEIMIDIDLAKRIFLELDSVSINQEENKLSVVFHSFDKNKSDFKEFAIVIGYEGWGRNDVYFFHNKKIIAKHNIFYRYELELEHFKNENNQTIVFYKVCYSSGTGIWWHQFNFYQYNKDQLIPVLTEIQNINLQYPWSIRAYWIETKVVNERPLQIKFVYNNQFFNISETNYSEINFINDSTIVTYHLDTQSGKYIPDFNGTKQNRNKLTSYFHSDKELLFVNSHYNLFKNRLNENDTIMRKAILNYLNDLKNGLERK